MSRSHGEEDLSGLLEFLLNISEDGSLSARRHELVSSTFADSISRLTDPRITAFFDAEKLIQFSFWDCASDITERVKLRVYKII